MESNTQKPNSKTRKNESKTSTTELFSSAQVVAEAAKAGFRRENHKIDKAKAADAAANILHAASHYGKLEEKSMGKYVEKAENYLHQYHSSHSTSSTDTSTKPTMNSTTQQSPSHNSTSSKPHNTSSSQQSSGKKKKQKDETQEGIGSYIKLAEGFLGKQSGDHSTGGGVGQYAKLAHGLMKKH